MTFKYNNVFVKETATIAGPYEKKGPLKDEFDKTFDSLYYNQKTWEKAESKIFEDTIDLLIEKSKIDKNIVDVIIAGDLQNQISSSTYGSKKYDTSFLGIYKYISDIFIPPHIPS